MSIAVKDEISRPISFTSSLVYLISSIIAISNSVFFAGLFRQEAVGQLHFPVLPFHSLPLRILVCLFLEACLALVFGLFMTRLFAGGRGFRRVATFILAMLAAWTELLNIQWFVLTGPPLDFFEHMIFAFFALMALCLGLYLLAAEWSRQSSMRLRARKIRFAVSDRSGRVGLLAIRAMAFVLMYLLLVALSLPSSGPTPPETWQSKVTFFMHPVA
jgi:hypothetical protein